MIHKEPDSEDNTYLSMSHCEVDIEDCQFKSIKKGRAISDPHLLTWGSKYYYIISGAV